MRRCFFGIVLAFFCSLTMARGAEVLFESRPYLGTMVSMTLCYAPGEKDRASVAFNAAWQQFADVQAHMNAFDPASDVSVLNVSADQEVVVHGVQGVLRGQDLYRGRIKA